MVIGPKVVVAVVFEVVDELVAPSVDTLVVVAVDQLSLFSKLKQMVSFLLMIFWNRTKFFLWWETRSHEIF